MLSSSSVSFPFLHFSFLCFIQVSLPLPALTWAGCSLGVYPNTTSALLLCCVSAPQFFAVAEGQELVKTNSTPQQNQSEPEQDSLGIHCDGADCQGHGQFDGLIGLWGICSSKCLVKYFACLNCGRNYGSDMSIIKKIWRESLKL